MLLRCFPQADRLGASLKCGDFWLLSLHLSGFLCGLQPPNPGLASEGSVLTPVSRQRCSALFWARWSYIQAFFQAAILRHQPPEGWSLYHSTRLPHFQSHLYSVFIINCPLSFQKEHRFLCDDPLENRPFLLFQPHPGPAQNGSGLGFASDSLLLFLVLPALVSRFHSHRSWFIPLFPRNLGLIGLKKKNT